MPQNQKDETEKPPNDIKTETSEKKEREGGTPMLKIHPKNHNPLTKGKTTTQPFRINNLRE